MKLWTAVALALMVGAPASGLAQRGGFGGGGMGGMGMGGMPRFEAPELPGLELAGPPDSSEAVRLLDLRDDQPDRYAGARSVFMTETSPARDSVNGQLRIMDEKLGGGDRAAALFYAERATRISRGLKDRQEKWEDGTLFKILSGDQQKTYKKWKKDAEDATEEKQKRDVMRWNPMMAGGMGGGADRLEDKTVIAAPPGNPAGTASAVRVGRTVYVAGQVALDAEGSLVGENDLRAQAVKAFANLTTVLQSARARPTDVVQMTVHIVSYKPQDLAMIREVAAAFLPEANPPALTVLGVQSLFREGLLISVEATALAAPATRSTAR